MQTWLVHMRHPLELGRTLGMRGFVGFQIVVGGTPFTLLLNPVLALLTTLWYLTQAGWIETLLPGWIYLAACTSLVLGNLAFTFVNMIAVARRNLWEQLAWTALSPIYWTLMSIAPWKALLQLITRPSYWEKTEHGFTAPPIAPGLGASGGTRGPASA
jgi:glycosyltransferase XagB